MKTRRNRTPRKPYKRTRKHVRRQRHVGGERQHLGLLINEYLLVLNTRNNYAEDSYEYMINTRKLKNIQDKIFEIYDKFPNPAKAQAYKDTFNMQIELRRYRNDIKNLESMKSQYPDIVDKPFYKDIKTQIGKLETQLEDMTAEPRAIIRRPRKRKMSPQFDKNEEQDILDLLSAGDV